jgi:UDP-GlcNAc:undecaprenyl-phosphate/decaprenyl-phosphate GlcNAc-1-phosphate transferase
MGRAAVYSLIGALIAFVVSSAFIPLIRRVALAVRAVDYPGGRREQAEGIPRLGGVAVVFGLFVSQAVLAVLQWNAWKADMSAAEIVAVPLAFFIIFICGLLEDTVGLSPLVRVVLQAIAAIVVIRVGWCFGTIYIPFVGSLHFGILSCLISLLWIVGVTNAINLLDGLDGLAGGVVAIIAAGLLVFSLGNGDFVAAMIMGTIVGACLGFLRKNWAPAQIYLGDAGSLTFGFMLAVVSVHSSLKTSAVIAILIPILALGLPVIDTLLVMLFRFTQKSRGPLAQRAGRMFHADRSHLHHLMLRLGPSRSRIVIGIYAVAVIFCALALVAATYRNATLGFILIAFEILVIFAIRQLGLNADVLRMSIDKRRMIREVIFRRGAGVVDVER